MNWLFGGYIDAKVFKIYEGCVKQLLKDVNV